MNIRKAERNLNRTVLPETDAPLRMKIYWFQYHHEAPREKASLHHHTFFEVHFVRSGSVSYRFEDGTLLSLSAGEWVLIAPEIPHIVKETSSHFQKFSLGFSFEDIKENPLTETVTALFQSASFTHGKDTPSCERLFSETLRTAEEMTPLSPYRIRNIVFALVEELVRACGGLQKSAASSFASPSEDIRVLRAKRYITDNIRRSFTSADVAANVHLSEKQLCRVFLESEGESVADFIRREKLKEAKSLLRTSDAPLKAISEALGHSSEYNFIRFFKNAEGMPPGAFRKITRK